LKLELLNEGITCPHCQSYTDHIHQTRLMLIRDLSILPAFFLEKPPKLLNTIFPIFAIILLIEQPVELWRD
ncbi:transposase family protein, partial [Planktothrix sp.]|uniref:transposase family protein n=1 Tax=Planktothrix sp. TaxID=3088171 RepID=UPI0038D421AD